MNCPNEHCKTANGLQPLSRRVEKLLESLIIKCPESQELVKSYFPKNLSTKNYISDATTQCIKIRKNSHLFKPIIGKWKKFQENHFGSCRKFTG